ncbi:hypothetical protein B0H17DRAFT_1191810 [Mycena rosella]|uniref:Uncharacterized protein n=1 Tax=Mycena rosella TaxID=1033263 RepID=A0AAD7GZ77_MYCRO|nr:hypothetical protein B0H17DRAFT_1191810 [Mycena rosella]
MSAFKSKPAPRLQHLANMTRNFLLNEERVLAELLRAPVIVDRATGQVIDFKLRTEVDNKLGLDLDRTRTTDPVPTICIRPPSRSVPIAGNISQEVYYNMIQRSRDGNFFSESKPFSALFLPEAGFTAEIGIFGGVIGAVFDDEVDGALALFFDIDLTIRRLDLSGGLRRNRGLPGYAAYCSRRLVGIRRPSI